ncbi:uncharacterized protein LOC133743286 [Rosa rugosa]|uniref:uncharacterized protein LOC133743286 n=1 Tax=Rosa rugosa TaxID=74645 RepID=UPI002B404430|nr:uncharacterized protein LOC133743286 [Rosa rugosa]
MGGACSRKRNHRDDEDNFPRGISRRYSKSGSSKCLATSFSRPAIDIQHEKGQCPSLMDFYVRQICERASAKELLKHCFIRTARKSPRLERIRIFGCENSSWRTRG